MTTLAECNIGDVVQVFVDNIGYIIPRKSSNTLRATIIGIDRNVNRSLLGWKHDEVRYSGAWNLAGAGARNHEMSTDCGEYTYAFYVENTFTIKSREQVKVAVYYSPPSGAPKHIHASDVVVNDVIAYATKGVGSIYHMVVIGIEEDEDNDGEACVLIRGKIYGEKTNKSEVKMKRSNVVLLIKREV